MGTPKGEMQPLLAKMLEKFSGDRIKAAKTIGMTPQSFSKLIYGRDVSETANERMQAILDGTATKFGPIRGAKANPAKRKQVPAPLAPASEVKADVVPDDEPEFEEIVQMDGSLGLAIVFARGKEAEAVYDTALALTAECVYRKRVGSRWCLIFKIADKNMMTAFVKITSIVDVDVITP